MSPPTNQEAINLNPGRKLFDSYQNAEESGLAPAKDSPSYVCRSKDLEIDKKGPLGDMQNKNKLGRFRKQKIPLQEVNREKTVLVKLMH